ncbi:MAG: hypothetical protein ACP5XB_20640 [Isosphaeraceae bacterium]
MSVYLSQIRRQRSSKHSPRLSATFNLALKAPVCRPFALETRSSRAAAARGSKVD